MGYSKKVYREGKRILAERRQKAGEEADRRRRQAYERLPRLREIDRQMAACGSRVIEAVMQGEKEMAPLMERLKQENLSLQEERRALLASAGWPEDYTEEKWSCPKCRDTGYAGNVRCSCYESLLGQIACRQLGSGWNEEEYTFENFSLDYYSPQPMEGTGVIPRQNARVVLDYCKEYSENFSPESGSLLLMGSTGLGKTHLALAIAGRVARKGCGVLYTTVQDLVARLEKERFRSDWEEDGEESFRDTLREADLLILDDLGVEFPSAFSTAAVNDLINARLMENRPTIVTTNLDHEELRRRYSERLISRLKGSRYDSFRLVGGDVRWTKKVQELRKGR